MKALAILSVVQTACILFLLFKVVGGEPSTNPLLGTEPPVRDRVQTGNPGGFEAAPTGPPPIDEIRLRQIIQEEFEYYMSVGAQPARSPEGGAGSVPRDPVADRRQREIVERRMAYFMNAGAVAPKELNDLYREIAKLHPNDRTEMLSRLSRAINEGRLEGHL